MLGAVFIALIGGAAVGMSRSINGRLTMDRGAFTASAWNHWIGFLLLSLYVLTLHRVGLPLLADVPAFYFVGGIIGGQMITGLVIDLARGTAEFHPGQPAGVALILTGIYLTRYTR